MKDITTAVQAATQKLIESGAIEAAIEAKLQSTIESIISEQLRAYSPFGEELKKAISSAIQVNFKDLSLPTYGQQILEVVRRQVAMQTTNAINTSVELQLSKLLEPAPEQITLSELVKDFVEYHKESGVDQYGEHVTVHMDDGSYGYRWISLDEKAGKTSYSCAIRMMVDTKENAIRALHYAGKKIEEQMFVGMALDRFEQRIWQMYASGTRLVIDCEADDLDTALYSED